MRLRMLLAQHAVRIMLIDAFHAVVRGGLSALHAREGRRVVAGHQGDWMSSGRPALTDGYCTHERLRGSAKIVVVDDLDAGLKYTVDARLHGEFILLGPAAVAKHAQVAAALQPNGAQIPVQFLQGEGRSHETTACSDGPAAYGLRVQ